MLTRHSCGVQATMQTRSVLARLAVPIFAAALFAAPSSLRAQDAQSRLWDGAASGDTVAISEALAAGAQIDSLDTRRSANGRRALNWAALANKPDAIRFLLRRGELPVVGKDEWPADGSGEAFPAGGDRIGDGSCRTEDRARGQRSGGTPQKRLTRYLTDHVPNC